MNAPALSQMGWIISMGKKPTYLILRKTINFNILRVVFSLLSPSTSQDASKLSEASQDFKKATSERNLNFLSSHFCPIPNAHQHFQQMSTVHVGYLDYDDRMYRLTRARCVFVNNQLDVGASGAKAKIKLYGIPFPNVDNVTELVGNSFGPDSDQIHSDPIAEGGIELRDGYLSWLSLSVRCTNHNPENNTLSVHFQGEVEDPDWGKTDTVDGMVVCEIREKLW